MPHFIQSSILSHPLPQPQLRKTPLSKIEDTIEIYSDALSCSVSQFAIITFPIKKQIFSLCISTELVGVIDIVHCVNKLPAVYSYSVYLYTQTKTKVENPSTALCFVNIQVMIAYLKTNDIYLLYL